jgi:hypothetical protein
MEKQDISGDIENVEHYLRELFEVPVGICIADTADVALDTRGYEISEMVREPRSGCTTAFQYLVRIEWAPWPDGGCWRLMHAVYRREPDYRSKVSSGVKEVERRPLLEMPIEVQRRAHPHLAQLVAAAGGEWQLLRTMMLMKRRAS